jgi:hypothetical protein
VAKFHNKDLKIKLVENRKIVAKKFNDKYFICNKIVHLVKDCNNMAHQSNLRKGMIIEANMTEVDYLIDEIS